LADNNSLQKWALIAEIIGGFAVVLSLLFVGFEIRQSSEETALNTLAIEADVTWSHAAINTELYADRANNGELAELVLRYRNLSAPKIEELYADQDADFFRFINHQAVHVNYWQARYLTQTSDTDRERLREAIRNRLVYPGNRAVMGKDQFLSVLHPEFSAYLTGIILEYE